MSASLNRMSGFFICLDLCDQGFFTTLATIENRLFCPVLMRSILALIDGL